MEDAIVSAAGSALVLTDSADQLPGHHSDVYAEAEAPTGLELERERIPLDSVRPGPPAAGDDDDDDGEDEEIVKPATPKAG